MPKKKPDYGNESITSLKGADRVRKRPAVIFGSDGLEGCEHSFFEILSNSIDEAREGFGDLIEVTRFLDGSIEIQDYGRGIPLDYNENEERFNWELVYCELYAGGKYDNNKGGMYEYSLGLNGLGACATQYSSEYMDVTVIRDKTKYTLHFEKGENVGGLTKVPVKSNKTGSTQKWKPDREVFTDIDIPLEFYQDVLNKQAMVNAGLRFVLYNETETGMEMFEYFYEKGIIDYVADTVGEQGFTTVESWEMEREGRDREDKEDYRMKMQIAFCFSNTVNLLEYYHNSSYLEHGGSPDKAVKNAFVYAIDNYLKQNNKYLLASADGKAGQISQADYTALLAEYNQSHGTVGRLSSAAAEYGRILNYIGLYEGKFEDLFVREIRKDNKYASVTFSTAADSANIKQYILKNDNGFWEVVYPNVQMDAYPINAINKLVPDFNVEVLPKYNLAAWRNMVKAEQGGAMAAMFSNYFITSKNDIAYQCATASCAYFRLKDGSRYVAYMNGEYWTATRVDSDVAAKNYFMERTGVDYSFIILDD